MRQQGGRAERKQHAQPQTQGSAQFSLSFPLFPKDKCFKQAAAGLKQRKPICLQTYFKTSLAEIAP